MKTFLLTLNLILVTIMPSTGVSAESGPPPMLEVDATGQGANADDAFKQAVIDAVRQVVGTLVSAENVVKNDKVIKDEVLTLSNGFVEKVLNQDKTKLDDGTWQVKLKCIVRKGQLYGTLQKANVPTIKLDGVSIFADVVSQLSVEKDASALLVEAISGWNGNMYEAVSLATKPEIIGKTEDTVTIRLSCRVTLRRPIYEKQFLGKLTNVLEGIAVKKISDKLSLDEINSMIDDSHVDGGTVIYDGSHGVNVMFVDGVSGGYAISEALITKAKTRLFKENIRADLQVIAVFRDASDDCLLIRMGEQYLSTATYAQGFRRICHISPKLRRTPSKEDDSDSREIKFDTIIPLQFLAKIAKIELHVATALDAFLAYNQMPSDAPGGFLYCRYETGWLYKFVKPSEKTEAWNNGESCYLPTLQMTNQSLEFRSQKK